ncbi:MAG: hypothetical protein HFG80_05890 [Eubacterium sp.]|nr:hypothetical protein [Eubacterium sp.]
MESNEVMKNEEILEPVAEEIVNAGFGSGFKTAAGFGMGILAGIAICKLVKPMIAKIRTRKEEAAIIDVEATEQESEEDEEETVD